MNYGKFYETFIKSVEGYSDYLGNDDIKLPKSKNKLNNIKNIENDEEYLNGMLDINNNLNNILTKLESRLDKKKCKTVQDENNKNKLLSMLGLKQIELYTNKEEILYDIRDLGLADLPSHDVDEAIMANEKKNLYKSDMIKNNYQKYLLLFLVIILCIIIIIINP